MTAILFPDVEAVVESYLTDALAARTEPHAANVYVANALPVTRRARMVIVNRDGGPRLDTIRDSARLRVRVYGRTDAETRDLAALVRALIGAAADGKPVVRVTEVAGPVPFDDPASDVDPRLMTFVVVTRGTAL